ncbi:barstar family protein [Streptomyces sp. URMC 123]|uniref:barstar family protein n=1 Tax=Streptomyces sp. URMC 123 TaxID=3423403 RepID=UPI003F1BF5AF
MTRAEQGAPTPPELAAVLDGSVPPGMLAWPGDRPVEEAVAAARDAGWSAVLLDLDGVTDKERFMDRCAEALRLPDWFGRTWDGLADCLIDLSWCPPAPGRLLALRAWQGYAAAAPRDWAVVEDVLTGAVAFWHTTPPGLAVVVPRAADA